MKKWLHLFFMLLLATILCAEERCPQEDKVGLLVMATGKYDVIAVKMIETARKFFLPKHERTFFIFTDGTVPESKDIVKVEQKKLGRPYDTLKRFHVYYAHKDLFEGIDYLYAMDADMEFVAEVGDEVLGDLVATRHWAFLNSPGPYCGNEKSTAYVAKKQRKHYCTGSFYGGKREEVLKLLEVNIRLVDLDLKKKFIPKWHGESYLNRYFIDHTPTLFLTPSYCLPPGVHVPKCEPKIITLANQCTELRK